MFGYDCLSVGVGTFMHFSGDPTNPIDFSITPYGFNTRNTRKRGRSFHYKG